MKVSNTFQKELNSRNPELKQVTDSLGSNLNRLALSPKINSSSLLFLGFLVSKTSSILSLGNDGNVGSDGREPAILK